MSYIFVVKICEQHLLAIGKTQTFLLYRALDRA